MLNYKCEVKPQPTKNYRKKILNFVFAKLKPLKKGCEGNDK